jgi:hypothetical protein
MKQVIQEIASQDIIDTLAGEESLAANCENADMTIVNSVVKFIDEGDDYMQTYENIRDTVEYVQAISIEDN